MTVQGRRLHTSKVMREKARARDLAVLPTIMALQRQGITSARGLARALNDRGIAAPRGGQWQATQVQRLLARATAGD